MSGIAVQVQMFDVIMLMSRALIGRSKERARMGAGPEHERTGRLQRNKRAFAIT